MFNRSCSTCTTLRAILSDREEVHLERERGWNKEKGELLDRILALARPDVLNHMKRLEAPPQKKQVETFRPTLHSLPSVLPSPPPSQGEEVS